MSKDRMTANDYNMITFFHETNGDITRWSEWEKRKDVIQKFHPELIDAVNRLEIASRTLNSLIETITDKGSTEVYKKYGEY